MYVYFLKEQSPVELFSEWIDERQYNTDREIISGLLAQIDEMG